MQQEINHTRQFSQSPQEVWEYLTNPVLLEQWLGKNDFRPVVGHNFRFVSPYGNDSYCEVLEVKPFSRLSYSWQKNSAVDHHPFHSIIIWTLVPTENGTELQLVHTGFSNIEDYTAHQGGWGTCLRMLDELINHEHEKSNAYADPSKL